MAITTVESAQKFRVGRVSGNTVFVVVVFLCVFLRLMSQIVYTVNMKSINKYYEIVSVFVYYPKYLSTTNTVSISYIATTVDSRP